jgi:hypothetical protein
MERKAVASAQRRRTSCITKNTPTPCGNDNVLLSVGMYYQTQIAYLFVIPIFISILFVA